MSPTRPGKFFASPLSHRQSPIPVDHPITPAQESPSPCPERHWYNDPCNYLG